MTTVAVPTAAGTRRGDAWRPLARVLYALVAASAAVLVSTVLAGPTLEALSLVPVGPAWIALSKLSEVGWRVSIVVLLMMASGASLRSMYLTRGRLHLGIGVGLAGFALCAALAFLPMLAKEAGWRQFRSLAPWILIFVVADGFGEELLFRGLFLQRLERLMGNGRSNVLAAAAFTLLKMHVPSLSDPMTLPLLLFPLALIWGWLMQKSGSLWGSALLHAGADCLIIFGVCGTS